MKPGGGGRFAALKAVLEAQGAENPPALAAKIGRKKHGGEKMAEWSKGGRLRALKRKKKNARKRSKE